MLYLFPRSKKNTLKEIRSFLSRESSLKEKEEAKVRLLLSSNESLLF